MSERYRVRGRPRDGPIAAVYDFGILDDLLKAAILALNLRVNHGIVAWAEDDTKSDGFGLDVTEEAFALFVQTRKRPLNKRDEILVAEATEALLSKRWGPWIR
jgi:hypothetical protein